MDESLAIAIVHLRLLRAAHNKGDLIDPFSGLTADDLDRVFEALREPYPLTAEPCDLVSDVGSGRASNV